MANSKSTIYPIQLQGAELNLNKYDAEIKQYSGFNKNNSPFVGGCLSNVFTKKVENDSSSVFVDEEENVYTLDTTTDPNNFYLKKNDNIAVTYGKTAKCWHRKKVTPAENCIRMFSENIQLIKGSGFHFYLKTNADTYDLGQIPTNLSDDIIAYKLSAGIFLRANNKNIFVFAIHVIDVSACDLICTVDADTGELIDMIDRGQGTTTLNSYPISIIYNSSHSQIGVICKIIRNSVCYVSANFYTLHSDNTISGIAYDVDRFNPSWLATSAISSRYMPDPARWQFSSYPYNSATILESSAIGDMETGKDIMISLSGLYYDDTGLGGIRATSYKSTNNNAVKLFEDNEIQNKNIINGSQTGLISCYDYQHYLAQTPTSARKFMCVHYNSYEHKLTGFSYSSTSFNGSTVKKGSYVMGDFVPLGNSFHLLFNNNQFSGIAGSQVLLSNWNSVDLKTLCFKTGTYDGETKESLCYKEGDTWYVLYTGEPAFKVLGNQIVTNIDVAGNSYDYKREKILGFAPAFNGVSDGHLGSSGTIFDNSITNNFIYAAAINEYNLEDNASIILNPINLYLSDISPTPYTNHRVDFYSNTFTRDTNIEYIYTYYRAGLNTVTGIFDKDLAGLNYPADTNGNVMYSPNLFTDIVSEFGNNAYIKTGNKGYPLVIGNNLEFVFSYYLGNEVEGLEEIFVIQGQSYVIINNYIYAINFVNGVISNTQCIVSVENLQYCGQTPYMALFFSKTNRCLYSFTGANVLNQNKLVDKITTIIGYHYNPATQSNILFTDIGIIVISVFGIFKIDEDGHKVFILDNGVCFIINDEGTEKLLYLKYYLDADDTDYTKENIRLDTCFYGMNNQTVTINDCLYFRLFSEEHEEGDLKVSATTISLSGRKTEETTFKIKASDWDKITHTIYLRYQPKTQRGLGVSFSIDSPFKIASLSVGSQADAILVDKVSKGAINAPQQTSNNVEW